jgi:twinkle protein
MNELTEKIQEAKFKMGEDAIDIIVNDLSIDGWDEQKKQGICQFHLKDGQPESTPSFKWNKKDQAFHCFGCGKTYGIVDHYQHRGMSFKAAAERLFKETNTEYEFEKTNIRDYKYPRPEQRTNMSKVYKYLLSRKISKETVDKMDVAQDEKGNLVFEYYDQNDTLLTSKYRPSRKLKKGETKTWCQKDADTSHILWNMNRVRFDKPLHICEGEIESMCLVEAGIENAVSIPFGANNYHWIERNWEWLDMFPAFIVLSDNDEAGEKMKQEVIPRLGDWRCKTITFPQDVNDMNEILYKYGIEGLQTVIANASDVPIKDIVDMADVEDIDLANAVGIKTEVKELDKRLGKMFLGTLAVHTGINGSGKSSFLNQIAVCAPLNQGFKTFIFSGELNNAQLRNWVEYPLAGVENIEERYVADDQPIYYTVKWQAKQIMREWYRGKVFFYDNEIDKTAETIISRMEVLARKHGVKNFLIDNLMMVNISKYRGDSIFDKQKEFTLELLRFAIKYNVLVHLVAHPRKLDIVKRLNKMDVSGTGDITNLAHYVFAVHRVTRAEKEGIKNKGGEYITEPIPFDMILDLFKNRPIGFQDIEFGFYFDPKCKRFYKDDIEHYKQYGWDSRKVDVDKIMKEEFDKKWEQGEENLPWA